jgi:hypothetical protein
LRDAAIHYTLLIRTNVHYYSNDLSSRPVLGPELMILLVLEGGGKVPVGATTGWWLQYGLKGLSRVSLKGKHPIQNHMCCVGGVIKKLCVRRGVSGSSPRHGVNILPFHGPLVPSVGTGTNNSDPGFVVPLIKPGPKRVGNRKYEGILR